MSAIRCAVVALGALALALGFGCSEREAATAPDEGVRIVSLSPAATVMLVEMGLGGSLVGRHGFDFVADPAVRVVGDQTGLDYEALLGVAPTHVVIEPGSQEPPPRLVDLAAQRGFRLVQVRTLTLRDLAASASTLRDAFGLGDTNDAAEGVVERVAALGVSPAEGVAAGRAAIGRVLLVVAASPSVDCLGPGSAHHQVLSAAGFEPVLAEGGPWMTLGAEDIARLDPGAIVFVQPREGGEAPTLEQRLGPLAGLGIAAVRQGRIVVIDDPLSLIPSSNLASFRAELERGLDALGPLPSRRE